jgi:hypothetical protein
MSLRRWAVLTALLPGIAVAQPITATPLAPPPQAMPQQTPPAAVPQQPPPPLQPAPAQPAPPAVTATPSAPPATETPPWPDVWQPRGVVVLRMLDKINAQTATATVKVGESVSYGSLTIAARACDVRPPDQPADATAFLVITDRNPEAPGFTGWILRSDPSLSMLEHPLYDVRVAGCGG